MRTIIDLWNGNITPCEDCGAHDSEAKQFLYFMEQHRERLCNSLTEAQSKVFQKYIDCSEEYLFRMLELAFYDGFCIGGKLATEIIIR